MNRSDIEREIVETLGQVPPFFASMPDEVLERQWSDFKQFQFGDTVLSAREKQLIGYAVAAAIHCPYCTYFHRTATTLMGTDDKQLEEAARVAAETAMYSAYIHSGLFSLRMATFVVPCGIRWARRWIEAMTSLKENCTS